MDRDPWNWSVQDVQKFFREDAASYTADMPHGHLPPLDPFLSSLSNNDVSGAILLENVDAATLRDDCGVSSLGRRGAVLHCITKLRRQSIIYTAQNASFGLQTPPQIPPDLRTSTPAAAVTSEAPTENPQPVGEHVRAGELQVEDIHGRKRRRLDLSKPDELLNAKRILTDLTASTVRQGYLGDVAFPIDKIFYGNTDWGEEISYPQSSGNEIVLKPDREKGYADRNYFFVAQNATVGESRYVGSRMQHFLQKDFEDLELVRGGRPAIALSPYPERLCLKSPSVAVVRFNDSDRPVVVRENAVNLQNGNDIDEHIGQSSGEWDFLLERHAQDGNDVLPVYGSSESGDEEDDEASSSSANTDSEAEEDDEDEDGLSRARISQFIDDFIEQTIDAWTTFRLPRLEQKRAWTIWRMTKQSYSVRDALIHGAESWITHLNERLAKMKTDMVSYTYHTEAQLRAACVSTESTIQDIEKRKWMIDVWRRRQEPAHTAQTGKSSKKHRGAAATEQDPPLVIQPYDRYSVSPAPMAFEDLNHEADDEMQDDTHDNDDYNSDQIQYEADNEEFHTPTSSPALSQDMRDFILPSTEEVDEAEVDPLIDFEETAKEDIQEVQDREQARSLKDGSYLPTGDEIEGESESELPSPSTFVAAQKPKTPKNSRKVDLTAFSDSEPIRKPERTTKKVRTIVNPTGNPLDATADEVDSWDFQSLIKRDDRHRILIRLLREAGWEFRDALQEYFRVPQVGRATFVDHLQAAVMSLRTSTMNTSLPEDKAEVMSRAAEIFIRWTIPKLAEKGVGTLDSQSWNVLLDRKQLELFTNMLANTLIKKGSKLFVTPKPSPIKGSSSAPIDISSGSDTRMHAQPPKRGRPIKRSAAAKDSRVSAFNRQQRYNESQTTDSTQLVAMLGSDPSHSHIEINPSKEAGHDFIYVSDEVARRMKAHQIDGVRFLWREITADGEDKAQGCILAHTMGLGKTMQSIAFLSALNEAAASREPRVYEQLPPRLRLKANQKRRHLRTLILCPSSLISNWLREIEMWAKKQQLGHTFGLDTPVGSETLNMLQDWTKYGGVMIIGYPRFRIMLTPDKAKKKNSRAAEDFEAYQKMLLEGPDIVIADEAHNLKNIKASISEVASRIETHSRIALTGTPMANEVDEIYSLVTWSAPGFLGDPKEFRSYFSVPIKAGLYMESSSYEKTQSTKKLKILHADIGPKVNRANIEVLKGSLKSKVEFVIRIPLGATQERLFRRYLQLLRRSDKTDDASSVALFAWLDDLTLVTNHPDCLRQKLLRPRTKSKKKNAKSRLSTPGTASDSGSVTPLPPGLDETGDEETAEATGVENADSEEEKDSSFSTEEMRALLDEFPENKDPELSTKVGIFLKLLKFSHERQDKVLVFSRSLRTLDYLQELLISLGKEVGRIDGSIKMDDRTKTLEQFHNDGKFDKNGMNIMLVTTAAGGVGLNIPDANRVFIFDFSWNPTKEEQAIGRAYRLGQQKPVYVYHLMVAGTFEENIYNKRLFKSSLAKHVVDRKTVRRTAARDLMDYLYEPRVVPQTDVISKKGSDQHVLDRLLGQHGSEDEGKVDTMIRSVETMEILQEETKEIELTEEDQKDVDEQIKQGREGRRNYRPATQAMRPPHPPVPSTMQPPPTMPSMIHPQQPMPSTMQPQAVPGAHPILGPQPLASVMSAPGFNDPRTQFGGSRQQQASNNTKAPSYCNPNSQPSAPGPSHPYQPPASTNFPPEGGLPIPQDHKSN